jgi:hypothetical protein
MILRSTDVAAALRDRRSRLAPRRLQRGFFTLPAGIGFAGKPSGGGGPSGSTTTWDPSATAGTLTNGNLTVSFTGIPARASAGALGQRKYGEILIITRDTDQYVGIHRADVAYTSSAGALLMRAQPEAFTGGSTGATYISGTQAYTDGDIIMLAADTTSGTAANRKFWVGKNGAWQNGDPATGAGGNWHSLSDAVSWRPYIYNASGLARSATLNCGAVAFTYTAVWAGLQAAGFSAF